MMELDERRQAIRSNNQMLELVRYFFEYQQDAATDLELPTGLQLDHVGCLIHGDLNSARTLLRQNDLQIQRQFPSVVLANSLSKKYQRQVELAVLKTENKDICYEIFCVSNGALSEAEISAELPSSFHVAFLLQGSQALEMPAPWRPLESGVNPHEGSRMAYFSNGRSKLELITFLK